MLVTLRNTNGQERRGVILIVVLALLTLFTTVGLAFVLVSGSLADSARIAREEQTGNVPNTNPELAVSIFLGQLLYDVPDDANGVYSAMRGNSLERDMYGWNPPTNGPGQLNDRAFSGTGRLQTQSTTLGQPDCFLINYTWHRDTDPTTPLRDPERLGARASLAAAPGAYTGGFNPPYTYPDHNHVYLAAMRASDGKVLIPSFHRPYLFGSLVDRTNPNWTNQVGRYLTLRPRPIDHDPNRFPYPEDDGGDVKNYPYGPGGNDSIWIDLGAPVMTSPDGRKFKMLFAPLIVDLDNRINLLVHGNIMGLNNAHGGNQGWGPHEVNLSKVMLLSGGGATTEWQNIFLGNPPTGNAFVEGKYGKNRVPGAGGSFVGSSGVPQPWAMVDMDGIQTSGTRQPTTAISLPGTGATVPYQCFPLFPVPGYENSLQGEQNNFPRLYNVWRPTADDRTFPASNMASLLRLNDTGSEGLTSDLLRLCPNIFQNPHAARMVSTHTTDVDRGGFPAYVWDPNNANTQYVLAAGQLHPYGGGLPASPLVAFPNPNGPAPNRNTAPPTGSDFDPATWRSILATQQRLNLNRSLRPYPAPNPATGLINLANAATQTAYINAVTDRQNFAKDIFNCLRGATGAADPNTVVYGSPQFNALRYLAQLSVNMVDYIDEDNYQTTWPWYNVGGNSDVVVGTELPNLLINEVYVQLDNNSNDQGVKNPVPAMRQATSPANVSVWVELFNPQLNSATANHDAVLQQPGGTVVYQLELAAYANRANITTVFNDPANTLGASTFGTVTPFKTSTTAGFGTDPKTVLANNNNANNLPAFASTSATLNDSFYVVGPNTTFLANPNNDPNIPQTDPMLPVTHKATEMTYTVGAGSTATEAHSNPVVLLRRLACPNMPLNNNPWAAVGVPNVLYNPLVTVDMVRTTHAQDARGYLANGANPNVTGVTARSSYGRKEPFAGKSVVAQAPAVPPANQPKNTFFQHNYEFTTPPVNGALSNTLNIPFQWVTHLDRQIISPLELLEVSAFTPHLLSWEFSNAAATTHHRHLAPWMTQNARLYRFLELAETALLSSSGVALGGRVPGKVNINTIWDIEVFRALVDAQQGNSFAYDINRNYIGETEVNNTFNRLRNRRTPNLNAAAQQIGPTDQTLATTLGLAAPDRPFWGFGIGAAAGGDTLSTGPRGIDNTLLAFNNLGASTTNQFLPSTAPRLLLEPATYGVTGTTVHPYQRYELLNKIFNNVTTRSNVFAVWVTVGYFEVLDDTRRPVKLGAEIGRAEGQNVRHRFFAIVDRTKSTVFSGTLTPLNNQQTQPGTTETLINAGNSITDNRTGRAWTLQAGDQVVLEPDTDNEETVTLIQSGASIVFVPTRAHPAVANSSPKNAYLFNIRGNPGPWTRYDQRQDPCVLYWAVID
jgi:hypothetical protein